MRKACSISMLGGAVAALWACGDDGGAGGGAGAEPQGCAALELDATCDGRAAARYIATAAAFEVRSTELANAVLAACKGIATGYGADPGAVPATADLPSQVRGWCDEAGARVDAAFPPGAIEVSIGDALCRYDLAAQAACEAACSDDPGCGATLADPTARCLGDVAGSCDGACSGTCHGANNACVGMCSGACSGSCTAPTGMVTDAACSGDCQGSCDGSCTNAAGAMTACDGACAGTCLGQMTDTFCTRQPNLPSGACAVCETCQRYCLSAAGGTCDVAGAGVTISGMPAATADALRTFYPAIASAAAELDHANEVASLLSVLPAGLGASCSEELATSTATSAALLSAIADGAAAVTASFE